MPSARARGPSAKDVVFTAKPSATTTTDQKSRSNNEFTGVLLCAIMTARRVTRLHCGMSTTTTRRGLGFWMCLALVIGNMIGSGVFLLPASLAPYGVNSIYGWLATAAGSVLLAIVFARLARAYPNAAGPYVYPRQAFGEAAGFLIAWSYWISVWIGNAAIVTGTVAYLAELV